MIEIHDLVKRYGSLTAVNHLSLQVEKGEVLGLLGPNGSGKTTTIHCILALLSYDKGEIKLFGEPMKPSAYAIKRRIGIIPQEVAVFAELTVYQNIDYFCGLYVSDKNLRKKYVDEAIELVGLENFVKFLPKKLSGGLLRRLNIACGIAHKPELIFLDEPTVAVDPQSRNKILENIKELNRQGATIVYTSHYMEEVEALCDRIVIIDQGTVIAKGTKEELIAMIASNEKIMVEVPLLTDEQKNLLANAPGVKNITYDLPYLTVETQRGGGYFVKILHILEELKIPFSNIYRKDPSLNDVFLEITGKTLRDE